MSQIILETERAILNMMNKDDINLMSNILKPPKPELFKMIDESIASQDAFGFSIYNVFLKEEMKYIGYCGCKTIKYNDSSEVQLTWDIYKKFKEDDIDIEVTFAARNFMFKYFNIRSLYAFISNNDTHGMNTAEAIDMVLESTFTDKTGGWLVYVVYRTSPKFLASFGSGESEPVLSSSLNRDDNRPSLVKNLKRPRLRPK